MKREKKGVPLTHTQIYSPKKNECLHGYRRAAAGEGGVGEKKHNNAAKQIPAGNTARP